MKMRRFSGDGVRGGCRISHDVVHGLCIGSSGFRWSAFSSLLLVAVVADLCRAQENDAVEATSSSRAPTEEHPARNKVDITMLTVDLRNPLKFFEHRKSSLKWRLTNPFRYGVPSFDLFEYFNPNVEEFSFERGDGVSDFLRFLCETVLPKNVSAVFICNDIYSEDVGNAARFFLRLTDQLGVPVFTMQMATTGSEDTASKNLIQMETPIAHQVSAILSILRRYTWCKFSIVTTYAAGHGAFVREVKKQMAIHSQSEERLTLLATVTINPTGDNATVLNELSSLQRTNTLVIVLYASENEAKRVFDIAKDTHLGSKSHVWIFPGFNFGISLHSYLEVRSSVDFLGKQKSCANDFSIAASIFANMLESFMKDPNGKKVGLHSRWRCNTTEDEARENEEEGLIRYLRNFDYNRDGTKKYSSLTIYKHHGNKGWENLGYWTSEGLTIEDWPDKTLVILPEKPHLRVVFREERPFIIRRSTHDAVAGVCANNEAPCQGIQEIDDPKPGAKWCGVELQDSSVDDISKKTALHARHWLRVTNPGRGGGFKLCVPHTLDMINASLPENAEHRACCSGFCVDLLKKLASDMQFEYTLVPVENGNLGTEKKDGGWNGLMAALRRDEGDIVVSSFSINSMREKAIDFSMPFLDTGIAIAVAKRAGIGSPNAFLEPFETTSWIMILVVSVHLVTLVIFLLEWLSPSVYNMTLRAPRDYTFSLLRAYWTVWADLFNAAVQMYYPRSISARLMTSAWALFAVVLAAVYTANLATFMVTKEEYYHISGITDDRFADPTFRFGTTLAGNTESILRENYPDIYNRTMRFNKNSVEEGLAALKTGELDAFLYDATVLKYLANHDKDCKLNVVGKPFAETGYGIGFRQNSKYVASFNSKIMAYGEDGTLESLRNFWLPGHSSACDPNMLEQSSSKPVTLNQFATAFYVLGLGIVFGLFGLLVEHLYFRYRSQRLVKVDSRGCCAVVTRAVDQRVTYRCQVCEDYTLLRRHYCSDPSCRTQLFIKKRRN